VKGVRGIVPREWRDGNPSVLARPLLRSRRGLRLLQLSLGLLGDGDALEPGDVEVTLGDCKGTIEVKAF